MRSSMLGDPYKLIGTHLAGRYLIEVLTDDGGMSYAYKGRATPGKEDGCN